MLQRCRSEVDEYDIVEHSMTSKAGKNLFDREFRKVDGVLMMQTHALWFVHVRTKVRPGFSIPEIQR